MTSSKPTLIFIHGAWHTPNHASKLREQLQDYQWHVPALPSCGCQADSPITKSWQPDIDTVRQAILSTLSSSSNPNGKILIISHSYGGMATSEALQYVPAADRHRVRHITIASPLVDAGTCLLPDPSASAALPMWKVEGDLCWAVQPEKYLYHDLPPEEAQKWSAELTHVSSVLPSQTLTYAAQFDFKTTYVVCEQDASMMPEMQEGMVANALAKGASLEVMRLPSSHSPYLSMPGRVAEIVRGVADDRDW